MVNKRAIQTKNNSLKKLHEKIIKMRKILNNTYTNTHLDYESKLKVSQYMDELILEYYQLREEEIKKANS